MELRDQLDLEYTSLITSIEEVQALMEAEVASVWTPPSKADLEAFTEEVDKVLCLQPIVDERSSGDGCVEPSAPASVLGASTQPEIVAVGSDGGAETVAGIVPPVVRGPTSPTSVIARPRWADIASDSEEADCIESCTTQPTPVEREGYDKAAFKATTLCSKCNKYLGRHDFSRRAWRQARGLGNNERRQPRTEANGSVCLQCTGIQNNHHTPLAERR
jgi:hypothetical protein